jgi:hypothetical protein
VKEFQNAQGIIDNFAGQCGIRSATTDQSGIVSVPLDFCVLPF